MYFPKLKAAAQQRAGVEQFGGLDRRPGSGAGSLEHMENLWSSGYPALETRPLRRTVTQLAKPNGMTEKDGLFWVDGTALYVNGAKTGLVLTDSRKQLVSMGAYLLIFPDKKYINTQDLTDFGSMENVRTTTGEVTFTLCDGTGESLGSYAAGTEAPQEPRTGDLWLDTERSESVMRRYDGSTWTALTEVYTKIAAVGVGLGFRAGDGVTVAGCGAAELNGLHILQAAEDDWVLVPALCRTLDSQTAAVTVMRLMPEMDFVVEQGNRLWGCKYGIVDGQAVNEIYACALGDFRNWNSFAGLSTDSYAAARGSDGPFTGAAACMGGVVFFKESCMERIYPAAGGGHQIVTVPCSGVRKGAERTVAVADGVVYYLGNDGVYAFDGSMPVCVSRALGDKRYTGGVAGGESGRYWLSAVDAAGETELLVYDTQKRLWHRQDDTAAVAFARWNGEMTVLCSDGRLLDTSGTLGTAETGFSWSAESGDLGLYTPEHKYLSRLELRLKTAAGSTVKAYVCYDGDNVWEQVGGVSGEAGQTRGAVLQVRPRRCGHLRLKLAGDGPCRVYSAAAVYEKGSDGP